MPALRLVREQVEADLSALADWVALYRQWRPVLHSGRTVRPDADDLQLQFNGVVATDRRSALIATCSSMSWPTTAARSTITAVPAPGPDGPIGTMIITG